MFQPEQMEAPVEEPDVLSEEIAEPAADLEDGTVEE